jgi:hypothetical protein
MPVALVISGANVHDKWLLPEMLDRDRDDATPCPPPADRRALARRARMPRWSTRDPHPAPRL